MRAASARASRALRRDIRTALETLPGVRTKVGLGGSGEKYVLVLTGDDPQALQTAALAVEEDLRTISRPGQHRPPPAWCARKSPCAPTLPAPPTWA